MKPIDLNSTDIETLLASGCIYVDKTADLHRLITTPGQRLFFVARPRRFGKTLMLSTLKAIFQGRRELFAHLAIAKTDYDWPTYPVLHLDFSKINTETLETFRRGLAFRVQVAFEAAGLTYDSHLTPDENFDLALRSCDECGTKRMVVLIDEYDGPVCHALDDIEKATAIRSILSNFYIQIKANAPHIRFLLMTGVMKFTQLSVFSALNNLIDLTLDRSAATLLGYTEDELGAFFGEHIRAHAEVMGLSEGDYRERLRQWYDGYRFSTWSKETVYNPIAIGTTLSLKEPAFRSTWAQTGRTSALFNHLRREPLLEQDYENIKGQSSAIFDVCGLDELANITLLYQSGYLTIKDFDPAWGTYTLGIPNEEVREDLNALIVRAAAPGDENALLAAIRAALQAADFPAFFKCLRAFYARLPYQAKEGRVPEAGYQRLLFVLLSACGLRVTAEDCQAAGRADLVAKVRDIVFLFEIKVDASAADALAQIRARDYAAPYRATAHTLHLIGLSFSSADRLLADAQAVTETC